MVIDKTGIMNILRSSAQEIEEHRGEDSIYITTKSHDFDPQKQVGNDSIDLRINNTGYIISNDYVYINTLSNENFEKYFEKVELSPIKGFDLKPGDLLFIDTIERIHLVGDLIGRISGRSTFSRFGLSVHCTQDKFSSGINSVAALQIKNNSNAVLKIFPYQKLAQLIIEKTSHNEHPYNGTFSLEDEYKLPVVKDSDREQYDSRTRECINRLKPRKNSMLKKHGMSAKFNSLMQAILGFVVSTGVGICGLSSDKFIAIVFIVILAVIYISINIYFFIVSDAADREK